MPYPPAAQPGRETSKRVTAARATRIRRSVILTACTGTVRLDNSHVNICSGGGGPISVQAIPTLSGWAMIVMAAFLLLSSLAMMRRRAAD
jgi:hypothetical protein